MNNTTFAINETDVSTNQTTSVFLHPEIRADAIIWRVWTPCIILLGGFGNIATIFVMRRMKGSNSSQHVILISLAVADFTLLYIGALHRWLQFITGVDLRDLHSVVCKLHIWLVYSVGTISAWLLTCVTVQRILAVTWPHKVRMLCTVRRTWTVIAAIVMAACCLHFHFVLDVEVSTVYNMCLAIPSEHILDRVNVFIWIDLLLSSLLPSACLLVCDVVLSFTLFKATTGPSIAAHATTSTNSESRRKTASKTTVMILVLSCAFLVLTLPVCVFQFFDDLLPDSNKALWVDWIFTVTENLWYTNSAINFLLYTFTGTKFRTEFLRLFKCGTQDRSSATGRETTAKL